MNCCDDYGKCTGGKGCPVGDMPVQMVGPEPPDDLDVSTGDWLGLAILLATACGICFIAGIYFGKWVMA